MNLRILAPSLVVLVGSLGGCVVSSGPACGAGQLACGNVCVTVQGNDPNNCGGCGVVCGANQDCQGGVCTTTNPFPHLGQPGGPIPNTNAVYRILPGASTVVQPGVQPGYGITANTGGSYRLVWTGDASTSGTYREFWGSVYTPGNFTSVNPGCGGACSIQSNDMITQPTAAPGGGSRIDFDSVAADTLNGFDFVVDTEPVYFYFYIDGATYPNLVFFPATDNGGQVSNVATIPFGLTTQ